MAIDNLDDFLTEHSLGGAPFTPYVDWNPEADALTARFAGDADYSQRLTDHVTIFRSIETNELTGCRIKSVAAILEDLPNYIQINNGDDIRLSVLFLPFRGGLESDARETLNKLAKAAEGLKMGHLLAS